MTELPGYVLQSSLREGGEFIVHCGQRRTDFTAEEAAIPLQRGNGGLHASSCCRLVLH